MKWLSQIWWTSLSHNPGWAIAEQTSCYTSQSSDAWLSTWKRNEINLTQPLDTWSLMAISLSSKEVFNSFIMLSIFIINISRSKKTMGQRNRQECISECYIFLKDIYMICDDFCEGFPPRPRHHGARAYVDLTASRSRQEVRIRWWEPPHDIFTYRKNSNGNRKSQPWMRRFRCIPYWKWWVFLKLSCYFSGGVYLGSPLPLRQ